ncbi:hypothetical protein [Chitinophaga polysaccharea]|uniref:hypothetical protein n=1 Tax=Chitinophaga polysaccharea TaxID=1293035 RepID=UPI001159374F|nr:hypothetical protein [Chitinophaga polysaccharea]
MISKDELNENAFGEEENNELSEEQTAEGLDAEVSEEEKELLEEASTTDPTYSEELRMRGAKVDNRDDDGEPLNETDSLDVPGAELDDEQEQIGAEDEENNEYSTDKND